MGESRLQDNKNVYKIFGSKPLRQGNALEDPTQLGVQY